VLSGDDYSFEVDLWAFGVILYEMLSGRVRSLTSSPSFHSSRKRQEAFQTNTVPVDDPSWLSHFLPHVKCDEPMFESSCMTDDAVDLVSKVGLSFDCYDSELILICSQLLQKSPVARLSNITEIKKHPFFETMFVVLTWRECTIANMIGSNWDSVASRSLTPPWVPRLMSTRFAGVHFQEPIMYSGDRYTASDDPLPNFAFRVAPSSLSSASTRRQQVFNALDGCAPLVSWVDGSSWVGPCECEESSRHISERQGNLKTFSRWVKRALIRPVRSA
jgi:serine/threonine protein kinase